MKPICWIGKKFERQEEVLEQFRFKLMRSRKATEELQLPLLKFDLDRGDAVSISS